MYIIYNKQNHFNKNNRYRAAGLLLLLYIYIYIFIHNQTNQIIAFIKKNMIITPQHVPNLPKNALGIFMFFILYKLVIRYFTGTKPDKRKWGIETYIAAAIHQINCLLLGSYLMYRVYQLDETKLYGKWLSSSFFDKERNELFPEIDFLDQLFVLGQTAEMLTDFILYLRYPAFGRSYCIHHMTTMLCSGSSFFAVVPVGAPIVITTVMETGGLALNLVSIRLSLIPDIKPPKWMFNARLYFYTFTRMLGLFFVVLMTPYLSGTLPQITCMLLIYALIFVNLSWVYTMWKSKFKIKGTSNRSNNKSMNNTSTSYGEKINNKKSKLDTLRHQRRYHQQKLIDLDYEKEMAGFAD